MLYTVQNGLTLQESSYTLTQAVDLDSMDVVFETSDIFSQEGCFAADAAGVYSFSRIGDFDGISHFDFSTQEYTPAVTERNRDIVNFQMLE